MAQSAMLAASQAAEGTPPCQVPLFVARPQHQLKPQHMQMHTIIHLLLPCWLLLSQQRSSSSTLRGLEVGMQ
jgi:hypothetical protein